MSVAERNRAIVIDAYNALFSGDVDGFYKNFDEKCVLVEPESLPYSGTFVGLDAVKRAIEVVGATWDNLHMSLDSVAANEESAFAHFHVSLTSKRTGLTHAFPLIELWRIRDGRVIEFRPFYFDTYKIREIHGV